MSRVVQVQGEVSFSPICVVCFLPAQKHYTVERTFSYGREAIDAHVDVPLVTATMPLRCARAALKKWWVGGILGGCNPGAVVGLGLVDLLGRQRAGQSDSEYFPGAGDRR